MKTLFESDCENGFIDLIEEEGKLKVVSGFDRRAKGVAIALPAAEAADFSEALLKALGEPTARSVYDSVVRDAYMKDISNGA